MELTLQKLEADDSEISACQREIEAHLKSLDQMKQANANLTDDLNTERAEHDATKKTLARTQKELDTEMAALAEARTKIIKVTRLPPIEFFFSFTHC